jgi:hypothetical protein
MVHSFFERLYYAQLTHGEEDRLGWSPSKRGKFEVNSFYKVLSSLDGPFFPWRSIWRVNAPSKLAFFVWTTTLG